MQILQIVKSLAKQTPLYRYIVLTSITSGLGTAASYHRPMPLNNGLFENMHEDLALLSLSKPVQISATWSAQCKTCSTKCIR